MSQGPTDKTSEPSPVAQVKMSLPVQEKIAARQAKRAAKAAERQQRSDALKEEGNAFFRDGKYLDALDRYQEAIDVHGPSQKPILLANVAAAYLKLEMYPEAHEAADRALTADPTSIKARYRRAMARKHMEMWTASHIDFMALLVLDPENKAVEAEMEFVQERLCDPFCWEEEDTNSWSDHEAPALADDPQLGESLSESSDCEHTGNRIPCKFYNRSECKNGHACRFSHAPDEKSERDALGRNVCRYYLMGVCKFGEQCSYLHSKEYLLQEGWWTTTEWISRERKKYDFVQKLNKAIADYNNQTKASGTGQTSKKQSKGKKKRGHRARPGASESKVVPAKNPSMGTQIGQSSQGVGKKSKKKPTGYAHSRWDGYGSGGDDENGMFGFTGSEVEELLCQGVKPWDDDAWDVLDALHSYC